MDLSLDDRAWKARRRFALLALAVTAVLISWGGWVTSINAGMAVPDWPSSFGSYDPFRTGMPGWYEYAPVLAEHGHRLLGALVGFLTLILAVWTYLADSRRWARRLGIAALVLVSIQGLLGGLRVTENSLALAAVHACTAQIFVAVLAALALSTTKTWRSISSRLPDSDAAQTLRRTAYATVGLLYLQIVLGAVLRQFGHGIHGFYAALHIAGALIVSGLIIATFVLVQKHFDGYRGLNLSAWAMVLTLAVQFTLGLAAYVVLVTDMAASTRSTLQIVLASSHVLVGAILMGTTTATTLLAARRQAPQRRVTELLDESRRSTGDHSQSKPVLASTSPKADA
ncbi:cytochrome oxidase assembly protein [Longibacter salinarum]|uniref:Cytochrome oxidase assembly protein n=1 Tax=Longibacter salinarum TaxID=1850348 RepID=A0A2A8D0R7_9BACT|nr:COX15/CtaA family protein [Longibacter salinarum]PEN14552.1 cytochrome oxidase assembly protein [Longibacter salinarum]